MTVKTFFKSSFLLKGIFTLSLIVLIYISSVSYRHTAALTESSGLVVHSYKIHFELEQILSYLKDAETMQRGFVITQDSVFIQPFTADQNAIYKSYLNLKSLTSDDREQQANLDTLLQLISLRFKLMKITLQSVAADPLDDKQLEINIQRGKSVMENVYKQINKIYELETSYFKDYQEKYENEVIFTPIFTLIIMLFSLVVFTLSFFKINKDLFVLKKSNEKLLITTESMKHAEEIGDFYISQWNLETDEHIFSDNLFRLLGHEPQSFPPTFDNYVKFIHPDDLENVVSGIKKVETEKSGQLLFYRIIRKDGEVRYFESIGKFIPEISNRLYISITRDITDYHLGKIALEERNLELEQSIKELESFNRVASHDLQEPLRKIQTFLSRIPDDDKANLSEASKTYLAKIESSSGRMRTLIDDLLLFSRTTKSEKVFEKTDLNQVLETARQELAQDIDEKKARIQSDPLPVLNAIPFQMQQLFVNLIGNALKYSKQEINPYIKISSEKIEPADYPHFITDKNKKYVKISFTDNGVGFEQQYAEKIFLLFNRLHQPNEYPGSGIGLTICKKITENHNGFIVADGKPGVGATFTVYLPTQ